MKNIKALGTVVTLANANTLACKIAQAVIGNDVADTINGSPLTREALYSLAQSRFQMHLNTHRGNPNA